MMLPRKKKVAHKQAKFDLLKPIKEFSKLSKELFYYKDCATKADTMRAHTIPPSIQKHMRLKEYDRKNGVFLMDDGMNYAAVYEIRGFPTEGRDDNALRTYAQMMQQIVSVFDRHPLNKAPYIVQCYVSDEPNLFSWYERLKTYASPDIRETKLNKVYIQMAKEHMKYMCREGGVFEDELTGNPFKGGERVTRLVFYRKAPYEKGKNRLAEIKKTCRDLDSKLKNFSKRSLNYRRYDDKDMFYWLFTTFNKKVTGFDEVTDYLDTFPYLENYEDRPYGYHFMENAFHTGMKSNMDKKQWKVGDTYHKHISCTGIKEAPELGKITAEREIAKDSGAYEAFFDSMPENSMMHLTFVCQSDVEVSNTIELKVKAANKSTSMDAAMIMEESQHWLRQIKKRNYLFPTQIGCYVSGLSEEEVEDRYSDASSIMTSAGFEIIKEEYDLYTIDKFVRFLPANYDHSFDNQYYSSKLISLEHIARMMPIGYSRNKGTGNPLICDYNRNGEPVTFDTFKDLANNPHLLMLGTTGAGKSVRAANMMLSVMAMYKPYLMIVDAGKSFEFLVLFFEYMGLSVQRFMIEKPREGVLPEFSLNPFLDTRLMINQVEEMEKIQALADIVANEDELVNKEIEKQAEGEALSNLFTPKDEKEKSRDNLSTSQEDDDEDIQRDYIAEFQLAALLMCSDGKEPEEVGITYDHRSELLTAVIECAKDVVHVQGKAQMIPSDLVNYMLAKVKRLENSTMHHEKDIADKLRTLAKRLQGFLNNAMNNLYFNRPSKALVTTDVTYFEMGMWKNDNEANNAPRALAFIIMMNRNMAQAEARQKQKDSRFSLFFGDECHIVTTKKVTAACLTQCSKMSRKVGLYLWFATQNVKDFTENASKMLSMFEFWICLEMSMNEFRQVTEYIEVSDLEENLFKTVHNQKGVYTEGVILSKRHKLLIRCFPFRELLFLAFNEMKEKGKRTKVALEYNCNEVEAALLQAQQAKDLPMDLEKVRKILAA